MDGKKRVDRNGKMDGSQLTCAGGESSVARSLVFSYLLNGADDLNVKRLTSLSILMMGSYEHD